MGWRDFTVPSLKVLGAATLAGALSVAGTLTGAAAAFSGALTITNTINATGADTGALQVAGGAYIAKDLFVGDDINLQNTQQILYRNAADSAWLDAMRVNASDILLLGASMGEVRFGSGQGFILTSTAATFSVAAYGSRVTNGLESSFTASSSVPGFSWIETDGAANNQHWQAFVNGEAWKFRALNDAGSASSTFMQVNRTGTAVDKIEFGAAEYDFQANNLGASYFSLTPAAATFSVTTVVQNTLVPRNADNTASWQQHIQLQRGDGSGSVCTIETFGNASNGMTGAGLAHAGSFSLIWSGSYAQSVQQHRFADGSSSSPSITFNSDQDSGMFSSGANLVGFAAAGITAFTYNQAKIFVQAGIALRFIGQAGTTAAPAAGDICYDTTANKHKGYDGTSWNDLY